MRLIMEQTRIVHIAHIRFTHDAKQGANENSLISCEVEYMGLHWRQRLMNDLATS